MQAPRVGWRLGKGWPSSCIRGLAVPATELGNFLLSQGLPVCPTNLANLVLSRQGVPLGEDPLLCQPHLCLPSIFCRLLRQELRSQGLWLRAGRRGTDPLAVSSRAGPCARPGLVLCCPPAPRRSECPTATPSHRCFAAPAPPALPQRSPEPGGSQHRPRGVLLGQVARGGRSLALQRGPSAQVLLRVARPAGRVLSCDTEQAIKHQRHQSSPRPGPASHSLSGAEEGPWVPGAGEVSGGDGGVCSPVITAQCRNVWCSLTRPSCGQLSSAARLGWAPPPLPPRISMEWFGLEETVKLILFHLR